MIHPAFGYLFLAAMTVLIFLINSINLKKNRAIHCRAVMINLKSRRQNDPENVSDEDVKKAVIKYNESAEIFNSAISGKAGTVLNVLLRYPLFELSPVEENK